MPKRLRKGWSRGSRTRRVVTVRDFDNYGNRPDAVKATYTWRAKFDIISIKGTTPIVVRFRGNCPSMPFFNGTGYAGADGTYEETLVSPQGYPDVYGRPAIAQVSPAIVQSIIAAQYTSGICTASQLDFKFTPGYTIDWNGDTIVDAAKVNIGVWIDRGTQKAALATLPWPAYQANNYKPKWSMRQGPDQSPLMHFRKTVSTSQALILNKKTNLFLRDDTTNALEYGHPPYGPVNDAHNQWSWVIGFWTQNPDKSGSLAAYGKLEVTMKYWDIATNPAAAFSSYVPILDGPDSGTGVSSPQVNLPIAAPADDEDDEEDVE